MNVLFDLLIAAHFCIFSAREHIVGMEQRQQQILRNQVNLYFLLCQYGMASVIQHCFIGRPSESTVSEDAGIKPRTVATLALAARSSNHLAR